jgi:hypothetical protein
LAEVFPGHREFRWDTGMTDSSNNHPLSEGFRHNLQEAAFTKQLARAAGVSG